MLFKKCERKKHSALLVLTVGALAAVGVISITRRGKEMACCMKEKVCGIFKKGDCSEEKNDA